MNGNKLVKYLGYVSNHPELLIFLEEQGVDITRLPDLSLPDKKLDKKKQVTFKNHGFTLQFERDYPEQAEKQRQSDPEGRFVVTAADYRIKNPVGDGSLYLDHIVFYKPEVGIDPQKPLQLPFGLQFMDNRHKLQLQFGHKNTHGDPRKPYYEEDESDYYHHNYKLVTYFERFDLEEKLLQLLVSLKK
ncbi:hypothetical protein SAMN05421821_10672 [Mucilaginibacter lappiensis]|uniref:Uncharacterized protein n=1 Tax=Mucilaginibacter lappiensis TaxID=354630 RepID=A0ABR6PMP3_9SPHI|nr:hypothetical protein [Mucilaginibacter lappiensis]MBB6110265.1 hypothetical protein [Mucilaginibacter lappiensis]SIR28389.1 hypothetical protein SAMN05421821_10672 [Mucilaginibacter lappiensis]